MVHSSKINYREAIKDYPLSALSDKEFSPLLAADMVFTSFYDSQVRSSV